MNLKLFFLPLAIMLSVVIVIWMAKPEWDSWQKTKADLKTADEEFKKVDEQVKKLEQALAEYNTLDKDKDLIMNAIPYTASRDDIYEAIYRVAKDSESMITELSIKQDSATNKCGVQSAGSGAVMVPPVAPTPAREDTITSPAIAIGAPPKAELCLVNENLMVTLLGAYTNVKRSVDLFGRMNRYAQISEVNFFKSKEQEGNLVEAMVVMDIFNKEATEDFQVGSALSTPTGAVLLQGKVERDVIEKYKSAVTEKAFVPLDVTQFGKQELF